MLHLVARTSFAVFPNRNWNWKISQDHVIFHSGNQTRDLDFEFNGPYFKFYGDNTDVAGGCAALFKGKMMYFGGFNNERQVSLEKYVFHS